MKQVTITLPDSVELNEQEIQALVLAQTGVAKPFSLPELSALLGRPVSAEEVADLRHLIGLYYAERATDLFDAEWQRRGWSADTMHEWLREHLRTAHGRPTA